MNAADAASVIFRTDSYPEIGLGHIKRCAALAHALRRVGVTSRMVVAADPSVDRVLGVQQLPAIMTKMRINTSNDVAVTLAVARRQNARIVVIDSYAVDELYFGAFEEAGLKTVYFEDYGNGNWPVDAVVNGVVGAEAIEYRAPRALLGPKYMVLDSEYWQPQIHGASTDGPLAILITTGGIDHYDLTSRTLDVLGMIEHPLKIHVIVGPYFNNEDKIAAAKVRCRHGTTIHRHPTSLADVIGRCGLAVSAGGRTLYELAAFAVPTIGIRLWENQRRNVENLGRMGAILPLTYEEGPAFDRMLGDAIAALIADPARRRTLGRAGAALVDGQGALRVAGTVAEMAKMPIPDSAFSGVATS